jgi:lipoic acid synthetase
MFLIIIWKLFQGLYLSIRPGARYFNSLKILSDAKDIMPEVFTKSGLMLGLGETKDEIMQGYG